MKPSANTVQIDGSAQGAGSNDWRSLTSIAMTGLRAVDLAVEKAIPGRDIARGMSRARRAEIPRHHDGKRQDHPSGAQRGRAVC
jgi:hypothetical protein